MSDPRLLSSTQPTDVHTTAAMPPPVALWRIVGRHVASLGYELLLLTALVLCLAMLIYAALPKGWAGGTLEFLLLLTLLFAYYSYCWRRGGQTLAMYLWQLYLIDLHTGWVGWRQIGIRFCVVSLAAIPLLWALAQQASLRAWASWSAPTALWLGAASLALPWLWALWDPAHRFLHDRLAGTRMVWRQKGTPHGRDAGGKEACVASRTPPSPDSSP